MATVNSPLGRMILAGGFAAAIAIVPLTAGFTATGNPTAACAVGESEDPYTFACVPDMSSIPGDSPVGAPTEGELTQCSGRDQGECLQQDLYAPAPVEQPDTTVQQSP